MRTPILLTAFSLFFPSAAAAQQVTTIANNMQASGDVSLDADDRVYVADFGSSLAGAGGRHIFVMDGDGQNRSIYATGFTGASGNEFDDRGNLYQSDVAAGEVYRVDKDGNREKLAEGLTTPVGVTPDGQGGAFVVECVRNRISHIMDGEVTLIFEGAPLLCPNGLTTGEDGTLYAVNFRDGGVVAIDPQARSARLLTTLPGGGNGHVAIANDRLYVASFRGHKIYSVSWEGKICHIAGSGVKGNEDGDALAASFFRPNGVAISADGNTLFTNTITSIVEPTSPLLHLNAMRRVDGLLELLDCPAERQVTKATPE